MGIDEFHKATADELIATKDKVRNLVNHWQEDGRYKEAIVKSVIEASLPSKYELVTGFVIKPDLEKSGAHLASNQIDLMVVNGAFPYFFRSGDFAVVTPDAVAAIIEVKTNLENQDLAKVVGKANENGRFILNDRINVQTLFNGIFSYEGYEIPPPGEKIQELYLKGCNAYLKEEFFKNFCVNNISFNRDRFMKVWDLDIGTERNSCYLYKIADFSFSFFISSLMDHLADLSVKQNISLWFPARNNLKVEIEFQLQPKPEAGKAL